MIKSDLRQVVNDEVEEKQKIMQQFTRDNKNWMRALDRIKLNAEN